MNVGIDRDICDKTKCIYYNTGNVNYVVSPLKRCTIMGNGGTEGLWDKDPIPDKCPYKNIHIIKSNKKARDKE